MQLVIFLNMEDAKCLAGDVSDASVVGQLIVRALRLRQMAGSEGENVFVICDEIEGRELLKRAEVECPGSVEKILRAFEVAGVIP
ncbi:MAG TPA: hypothetical protein VJQ55_17010 [Candidatus Binatia bacterium]|nr:hypothetical protein [Candidatus Binatia bacterium]